MQLTMHQSTQPNPSQHAALHNPDTIRECNNSVGATSTQNPSNPNKPHTNSHQHNHINTTVNNAINHPLKCTSRTAHTKARPSNHTITLTRRLNMVTRNKSQGTHIFGLEFTKGMAMQTPSIDQLTHMFRIKHPSHPTTSTSANKPKSEPIDSDIND